MTVKKSNKWIHEHKFKRAVIPIIRASPCQKVYKAGCEMWETLQWTLQQPVISGTEGTEASTGVQTSPRYCIDEILRSGLRPHKAKNRFFKYVEIYRAAYCIIQEQT